MSETITSGGNSTQHFLGDSQDKADDRQHETDDGEAALLKDDGGVTRDAAADRDEHDEGHQIRDGRNASERECGNQDQDGDQAVIILKSVFTVGRASS